MKFGVQVVNGWGRATDPAVHELPLPSARPQKENNLLSLYPEPCSELQAQNVLVFPQAPRQCRKVKSFIPHIFIENLLI